MKKPTPTGHRDRREKAGEKSHNEATADPDYPALTLAQGIFMRALARGLATRSAADEAGVSRNSSFEWTKLPHFKEALAQEKRNYINEVKGKLAVICLKATDRVVELVADPEVRPEVVVKIWQEAMNRAGFPATTREEVVVETPERLSPEQIATLLQELAGAPLVN